MKYKAKDIARELGVSPATISLVLNNKPGVGEEKRKEILQKIVELGLRISSQRWKREKRRYWICCL